MVTILLCLGPPPSFASHWQNPSFIQESFERIALQSEYNSAPQVLRRWEQPITYFIHHETGDKALHNQLTKIHLSQLASITGTTFLPAKTAESSKLQIYFTNEQNLGEDLKQKFELTGTQLTAIQHHNICLARISTAGNHIKHALVLIPVDRARANAKLLSCIVEELTQIMGLPNDDDRVFPSIFNDRSVDEFLTGLDYMLLKLLYHPSLRPGMSAKQVRSHVTKIMQTDEYQQWLNEADGQVRSSGLYPLLH
ncbi:DUF2927 domain-containing protein [Methylophaga frappieri]|uniref:DUF2927 domain-containing protein n=1 Tax=Methylophaga frappieri (strain ATCC BAA-2434 / DSM 25690 / JAM7) TaxID=754477 RepID=UPI0016516B12|nr:DUF2927 domain-containing protein [Methylophaga frappieri]